MAREVITCYGNKARVTHVLKDGTRLDTMEGYVIPYNEQNIPVIQNFFTVCDAILKQAEKRKAEKLLQKAQEEQNIDELLNKDN